MAADRSEGGAARPGDHAPLTPGWACDTCGEEWPCAPKRDLLLAEYRRDRAMLSVYLGACLAAATQDLHVGGPATVTCLQQRFIGWLPRRAKGF
ncbi:hypothetical protein GA0070616_3420 [Micromonospora nigra]|uniref:Flavin reductase n=1 Tax=Micromonospora nigra TaxID=145857 RepID=A0A1C6SCK4_9ACTN|nr:hypothetical protein [Micromonospora nigra]SCL27024.1 hypothetical protein GA0070616_3420 [Micromonospora nigra]